MKFRSRLVVDLNKLSSNIEAIKKLAPQAKILYMVKADCYGHGAVPVTRFAYENLGIREFGCAALAEAVKLREELFDLDLELYVFSDIQLNTDNIEIYLKRKILPVLSRLEDLDFILHIPEFKNFPLCLKFNTGMNRLGFNIDDAQLVINKLKSHGRTSVYHFVTHYANASNSMSEDPQNKLQHQRFTELKKFFRDSGINLERTSQSNSGCIEQQVGIEDTHVRPGIMVYGPTSLNPNLSHLSHYQGQLVSRLETYIIRTFDVVKGMPIGYGSTVCPYDGVVAVLAIGYGDGFSTKNSGAHVYHKGLTGIIFGRVNMDMLQVLFPKEARGKILDNEVFTLWGENEGDLLNFSIETKTIPYELFCALLPRVPRVYRLN